ncbi:unnamed protein product [Ectocarpus sp. 12 AP-2014]
MEARNVWVAWLALEALKAPLCGSFVLQQAPPPGRTKHEAAASPRCSAAAPRARCSCLRGLHDPLLRPLLRSPRASSSAIEPLSGTADDDNIGGDGVGKPGDEPPAAASDFDSDETGGVGTATGRAGVSTDVTKETRRLMSAPTIDIKLELQMRGVEHRDAFEKADLARRLAEARVSCRDNNPSPSPDDDDDATTTTTKAAGRKIGGAAADGPRENAHRSNKASMTTGNKPQAAAATAVATEGRGAASDGGSSSAYARDVARGTRMGKAALARELNGMGIAHSRLSDVSVLARQYAVRRQEAREDARRFPTSTARAGSSSSAEEDSEGGGEGRLEGKKSSGRRRGGGEEEEGWGDAREQRAASGLPWSFDKKEEEDDDEEDEAAGGGDAGFPLGGGGRDDVGEDAGSETGWSTRANAGSAATAGDDGGDKERSRKAVLHVRADRLSSRELMKALDGLGARYRIPAPRAELQQAFVSAVLAAEDDERSQADATAAASGTRGENIVPVSPYDAPLEEGDGGLRRTQGFGTYHSALRWARQLNFDDVLDELRYRGVEHSPRADYSYLTRLLADEVLADEELMGEEGGPEAGADTYTAEVEAAMSMSAQEMIRDLRAGGEIADVTLSKEALAERLAEMNLRLRGEPLAHSGSSAAYSYRGSPPPPQGRTRGGGGGGSTEARGPADPLGRRDGDEDVLLELEEAAKSVGGAALLVAREAAAFVSETAAGFFPPLPADDKDGGRSASPSAAERGGRGGGDGGGGGVQETERSRQVRAARERAGGVRRAATGYAQSSVNRAGFAVLQSLANGLLRSAEAAADWAGDGALAREFGRVAAQKLVLEGWKMERAKRRRATEGGGSGGGGGSNTAAAVGGGGATASRRGTSGYTAAPAGRRRRRPRPEKETETRRPRPKDARKKKGKERGSARSRRTKKPARKPLWEESDDDDRGCVVM